MLEQRLRDVSVIGAAGKMGSGIGLLMLEQLAERAALTDDSDYHIHLIDTQADALVGLRTYLVKQMTRWAEKNINSLRHYYRNKPQLVSNKEVVDHFVDQSLNLCCFDTELHRARNSGLVFEAVSEDPNVKQQVYASLNRVCDPSTYFLTNTSSIPISEIATFGGLEDRVIGYHFYNPPAVQQLLEIIHPKKIDSDLSLLAVQLGESMGKTIVRSHDVAGFIGNGHFLRELCFACAKVRELAWDQPLTLSLYLVNTIYKDWLIRPMGIFQLADYVGIDVCLAIARIMSDHIGNQEFEDELLRMPLQFKACGGQNADGSQKPGFFDYEGTRPTRILNLESGKYEAIDTYQQQAEALLGEKPSSWDAWKSMSKRPDKDALLADYFDDLFASTSNGAEIARSALIKSKEIGQGLVDEGVADTAEDVNTVLEKGFYHLYGPCNHYY